MKETKARISESRVRFISASILPCHSRAMRTQLQHLYCSTTRAHGAQFVSIEPTISYQGAIEDLVTQRIFHLSKSVSNTTSSSVSATIKILVQSIFVKPYLHFKPVYTHIFYQRGPCPQSNIHSAKTDSSHTAALYTMSVSSATSPVPEEFVSTAKTLY